MKDKNVEKKLPTHFFLPDMQVKPGIDLTYCSAIGDYIVDRKPDVIINAGDFADMESLSSYDKGTTSFEGRRYVKDIEAAIEGMALLMEPIYAEMKKDKTWKPRLVLTLGNHEERIMRYANMHPELSDAMSYDDLGYKEFGWEVYDFLEPVEIDGILYAHFFSNPFTGKPYSGTASSILPKIGQSFTQGHKQTLDISMKYYPNGKRHIGLVAGACLAPHHKVLTADLRYIPLGEVRVGDKLVSFDETVEESARRGRAYKTGTVLAVRHKKKAVKKVTFNDGSSIIATPDHLWIARAGGQTSQKAGTSYTWRTTDSLRVGSVIPKPLDVWETLTTYEAGYLSGIYDGEGCFYERETSAGRICQLSFSQKPGVVYDKVLECLDKICGLDLLSFQNQRGVLGARLKGGATSIAKFLGQVRPHRLLPKFKPELLGQVVSAPSRDLKVVNIEDAGEQDIVEIDIDAKTMIVEGQMHHNCYLHEESYKGYQGNHHFRGVVVKHEVKDGSYDPMFVGLKYIMERYYKKYPKKKK